MDAPATTTGPAGLLAIAAHLHVLLRRKTGRVTDTEWMAANPAYAAEVVRVARRSAVADGHADLAVWADKLETAMAAALPPRPVLASPPATSRVLDPMRYVGRLR